MEIAVRLLLTTIILTLLAQPAFAKTVYYCETFGLTQVKDDGEVLNFRPYRFKMAVSAERVEIRGKDFGEYYFYEPQVSADKKGVHAIQSGFFGSMYAMRFDPPELRLVSLDFPLTAFIAHCDDF